MWAEQLEIYRKKGVSVVFSAVSVVTLVLQASLLFCFANLALFKYDSGQFEYSASGTPPFATFFRYSFNSLLLSEIDSLKPLGSLSSWLSTVAGISVAVIGIVLIVAIVFGVKQSRDDEETRNAVEDMRERADGFAQKLTEEYRLPVEDLIDRVLEIGGFITLWLKYFGSIAEGVRGFEGWEAKRPIEEEE